MLQKEACDVGIRNFVLEDFPQFRIQHGYTRGVRIGADVLLVRIIQSQVPQIARYIFRLRQQFEENDSVAAHSRVKRGRSESIAESSCCRYSDGGKRSERASSAG